MCPNCPGSDECAHEVPKEDFSMMNFLYIEVMIFTVAKCFECINYSSVCSIISHNFLWDPITIRTKFDIKFNIFYRGVIKGVEVVQAPWLLDSFGLERFPCCYTSDAWLPWMFSCKERLLCPLASVSIQGSSWIGLTLRSLASKLRAQFPLLPDSEATHSPGYTIMQVNPQGIGVKEHQ